MSRNLKGNRNAQGDFIPRPLIEKDAKLEEVKTFLNKFYRKQDMISSDEALGTPEQTEYSAQYEILMKYPEVLDFLTDEEKETGTFPYPGSKEFQEFMNKAQAEIAKEK